VHIGKRQVEEIVATAAHDFEAFYAQPLPEETPTASAEQADSGIDLDGKGVVMRPEGLREGTARKLKPVHRGRPRFSHHAKANANEWRR